MCEISNLIYDLSLEQRQALADYRGQLINRANSTGSCDRELVENAICSLYRAADYALPDIIWCDSPAQLALMPLALEALLIPERKPAIQAFLGDEVLDGLLVKLCAQYNLTAFDGYETLLRPLNGRALRQLKLMRTFNRILRIRTLKPLHRRYRRTIASGAYSEIAMQLQGPLMRDYLSRTNAVRAALAQQVNELLKLRLRFGLQLWQSTLWSRPEADDSRSYRALLGTERDPCRTGNVPFAAHALETAIRTRSTDTLWMDRGLIKRDADSASVFTELSLFYDNVHFGWSSIPWLSHHDFARRHIDANMYADCNIGVWDAWWHLALEAWAYSLHEFVCFVADRPLAMHFDDGNRLHRSSEPCAVFADGTKAYAWHGTAVPRYVIEQPATITAKAIDDEQNVEVRRVMLERCGMARYLEDSHAVKVHEDDFGTLYRKPSTRRIPIRWSSQGRLEEPMVMVKVVNSTPEPDGSYKDYFLRVPPDIRTAKEAVAWTFGLDGSDYNPQVET